MSTTTYREQSRVFLAQASEELARGDLAQASEKGWGAAAQIVKAAADARGWEHSSHILLFRVARALANESDDPDLRRLFAVAQELHRNFYEGLLNAEEIATNLRDVALLVEKVEALLSADMNNGGRR